MDRFKNLPTFEEFVNEQEENLKVDCIYQVKMDFEINREEFKKFDYILITSDEEYNYTFMRSPDNSKVLIGNHIDGFQEHKMPQKKLIELVFSHQYIAPTQTIMNTWLGSRVNL